MIPDHTKNMPAFFVENSSPIGHTNAPVRIGIPLPQGLVRNAELIRLRDSRSKIVPIQARSLALWPDRTCKWALLDLLASLGPGEGDKYTVDGADAMPMASREAQPVIAVSRQASDLVIDTGLASFRLATNSLPFCVSLKIGGTELLASKGIDIILADKNGRACEPRINSCSIEEQGLLSCVIAYEGEFSVVVPQSVPVRFCMRLFFSAGTGLLRVDFVLHNPRAAIHPGGLWDLGDPASFFFSDLSFTLHAHDQPEDVCWQAHPTQLSTAIGEHPWCLYQDSSGGKQWNSPNHLDQYGSLTVTFPGYRVFSGAKRKIIREGERATPIIHYKTEAFSISCGMPHFWQNFPKALRVNNQSLGLGLFPKECGHPFELQPGERKRHTFFLNFGFHTPDTGLQQAIQPLHTALNPQWVEHAGVIPWFTPQANDAEKKYLAYINSIIDGERSFFSRRETIDEYGWRNFGDIYADHEAVNHTAPGLFISHYNNQYDFINAAGVHFLRSGDLRWSGLMADLARHVIDIDIYHTDEDKAAYNHGLFWHTDHYLPAQTATHRSYSRKNQLPGGNAYGGGPSNEHNYTSGILLYYYLTGDEEAKRAVLELAKYVIDMDDGGLTIFGIFDAGATGIASQTVGTGYHKPGRGAGNSINALMDAWRLVNDRKLLSKAEELIQRCIHPEDDIASLGLDDPEYRWSYLAFLQVLGKYLDLKVELGELDYFFQYARASLLHYADWMADHEVPYKDVLHKVLIPTETWPAHDVRKACIFLYAAKYGLPDREGIYRDKISFFFDRCLDDVLSFTTTSHLARPLVILAAYGWMPAYLQSHSSVSQPWPPHNYYFGSPCSFVPQRDRFRSTLANRARTAAGEAKRLLHAKLVQALRNLKRH